MIFIPDVVLYINIYIINIHIEYTFYSINIIIQIYYTVINSITKLYLIFTGEENQVVRLICIPKFSSTHAAVMVDIETLDTTIISFGKG
jgi:hypothetical protein